MKIYGYCIMSNHIHLIFRSSSGDPSGLIRGFKGFTSRKILKMIEENKKESRRKWMLSMFKEAGNNNCNVKDKQFWQQNNQPMEIWSMKIFKQKLKYTHDNPVKAGFVTDGADWK